MSFFVVTWGLSPLLSPLRNGWILSPGRWLAGSVGRSVNFGFSLMYYFMLLDWMSSDICVLVAHYPQDAGSASLYILITSSLRLRTFTYAFFTFSVEAVYPSTAAHHISWRPLYSSVEYSPSLSLSSRMGFCHCLSINAFLLFSFSLPSNCSFKVFFFPCHFELQIIYNSVLFTAGALSIINLSVDSFFIHSFPSVLPFILPFFDFPFVPPCLCDFVPVSPCLFRSVTPPELILTWLPSPPFSSSFILTFRLVLPSGSVFLSTSGLCVPKCDSLSCYGCSISGRSHMPASLTLAGSSTCVWNKGKKRQVSNT